jgi:hypothetical protein
VSPPAPSQEKSHVTHETDSETSGPGGTVAVLEAFVESNRDDLADAVLRRLDGMKVSLRGTPT